MKGNVAVIDIGFGDSGKGAVVDRLCAQGNVAGVVRFNGGCQAQHNVVQDDGRWHTFSQFGSGTFHGVPTFLSEHVLVEPLSLMNEAHALVKHRLDPWSLLHVDPRARVTTPYHWLVNRFLEDERGDARHGSCGRGIGQTMEHWLEAPDDAVQFRDLWNWPVLTRKLHAIRDWADNRTAGRCSLPHPGLVLDEYRKFNITAPHFADMMLWYVFANRGRLVFEGAQGVLLDEDWGFHPHTTWSHTTAVNARELAVEAEIELDVMAVARAYTTRHGAGPFVAEDNTLDLPENHNRREHFQGAWRVGHLDVPALLYATRCVQDVSGVYVTHVDAASREDRLRVCTGYELDGAPLPILPHIFDNFAARTKQTADLMNARPVLEDKQHTGWGTTVADALGLPLLGVGAGPATSDGRWLRQIVNA